MLGKNSWMVYIVSTPLNAIYICINIYIYIHTHTHWHQSGKEFYVHKILNKGMQLHTSL